MKKLFMPIVLLLMMTGCSGNIRGDSDYIGNSGSDNSLGSSSVIEEGDGEATTPRENIFSSPVKFRVLWENNGLYGFGYEGIAYSRRFDTNDFYIATQPHDGDGIPESIVSKIGVDNIPKVLCDKPDCLHIHSDCGAYMGNIVFTIDGKLYSIDTSYPEFGIDTNTIYTVGENGKEILAEYRDLFLYYDSEIYTDGKDIFYFSDENDGIYLKKINLTTGDLTTECALFENVSDGVPITFDDGVTKTGSIGSGSNIKIEDIADDGSYFIYSFYYAIPKISVNCGGKMIAKYDVATGKSTYLNANRSIYKDYFKNRNDRGKIKESYIFLNNKVIKKDTVTTEDTTVYKNVFYYDKGDWVEMPEVTEKLAGRQVMKTYKIDDKIVFDLYSDSWQVKDTAVVIDTKDMSVSTLTLKFPAYSAKYYRTPDIFGITKNDLIIGISNYGNGRVTLARISKENFFNSVGDYEQIGEFRLL